MIDFKYKNVGLSPNNYVEIKFNTETVSVGSQPQTLLILKKDNNDLNIFEKEKEFIDKFYPGLKCEYLTYTSLESCLEELPEKQFTQIVVIDAKETDLKTIDDALQKNWESPLELDGHFFFSSKLEKQELLTLATACNSPHISIIPTYGSEELWKWALSLAAINAKLALSPSRPYSGYKLLGVTPPISPPKLLERNELLAGGVSTFTVNGSSVYLDRIVTTYIKHPSGSLDPSYRDLNTKQILSALRYDLKQYFGLIMQGKSLARDDYAYAGDVITPKVAKALIISRFRKWQEHSLVQDPSELFAKNLQVEVDNEKGRLNILLPIVVMGQLYTTQTKIHFSL